MLSVTALKHKTHRIKSPTQPTLRTSRKHISVRPNWVLFWSNRPRCVCEYSLSIIKGQINQSDPKPSGTGAVLLYLRGFKQHTHTGGFRFTLHTRLVFFVGNCHRFLLFTYLPNSIFHPLPLNTPLI